jgi:hypothetical protein
MPGYACRAGKAIADWVVPRKKGFSQSRKARNSRILSLRPPSASTWILEFNLWNFKRYLLEIETFL